MSLSAPYHAIAELAAIDARRFAQDILPAAQPVVMRGLVNGWPVVTHGRDRADAVATYLKAFDNGVPTTVLEAPAATHGRLAYGADMRDFNFNRRQKTISAGLDDLLRAQQHPNPGYIYIQSTPTPQHLPGFAADNPNPLLPPAIARASGSLTPRARKFTTTMTIISPASQRVGDALPCFRQSN